MGPTFGAAHLPDGFPRRPAASMVSGHRAAMLADAGASRRLWQIIGNRWPSFERRATRSGKFSGIDGHDSGI
jgi:hypothetical protein